MHGLAHREGRVVGPARNFAECATEKARLRHAERGPIQVLEELPAAGAVEGHRPDVEIREQLSDAGVEGGEGGVEGEEGLVAKADENPPTRRWTATSILALSRGFAGRAGKTTVS